MKIIHFDCVHGIDEKFMHQDERYVFASFDDDFDESDDSIEILTCMHSSEISARVLECFPNIKYVITRTVGTDHIDKGFCDQAGIKYFSVGQYGPHVIATHAFLLLLSGARDLATCREMIEQGSYDYSHVQALDLNSKTMGVVGVGNIGKHILRLASAFGMKLQGFDIYEDKVFAWETWLSYVSPEELFATSDVICLACNLTSENKYMIDGQAISSMKDGVILINIARGELVDEDALLAWIKKFSFVGLDVISDESEAWLRKFLPYKNILITPHIAHFADSTVRNRWDKTYDIIKNL